MNYSEIKKLALKFFVGFLGLTAVIAIISVLAGQFGELQWKILATTFTISAASICAMSCAAYIEKKKMVVLGTSGIVLCIVSAGLVIFGMWPEIDNDAYWKMTISLGVFALGFAHAFLLLMGDLNGKQRVFQIISAISIGILATQIVMAVWLEVDSDIYYRLLAVTAIIVGLETLVVPILMKLRKGHASEKEVLVLEKLADGVYLAETGKKYTLCEVSESGS